MSEGIIQIKINKNDEWQGVVFRTTDYSQFKHLVGNRTVLDSRKNRIVRSVKANGQIYTVIIVNEKFEVIDGQGRLAAFQELGLPVNYVVVPGLTAKDCAILNATTTAWTMMDYIESYCDTGNESYIRLRDMLKRHKAIGTKAVMYAITNHINAAGEGSNAKHPEKLSVREGNFCMSKEIENKAETKCMYAEEFIPYFRAAGRKELIACGAIFAYDVIPDRDKLLTQWQKYSTAKSVERPAASMRDVMEMFESCYNYKVAAKNAFYISTEYDRIQRMRGAS